MPWKSSSANALRELLGQAGLLVDLDDAPGAHHAQVGTARRAPSPRPRPHRRRPRDGVARAHRRLGARRRRRRRAVPDSAPVLVRVGRVERELARAAGAGIAVDGDAGAVGPAARHLDEHRGEVLAEALLDARATWRRGRRSRTYGQKTTQSIRAKTLASRQRCTVRIWRNSPYTSEPGQVLAELPRRDLLVVAVPLVALHADEVVDVVLVAPAPERRRAARRRRSSSRVASSRFAGSVSSPRDRQLVVPDACRGCPSSARPRRARSRSRRGPAASTAAAARYGLHEPSIVRSSTRPGPGMRSIWVRLL